MSREVPDGYSYQPSSSEFVDHIGKLGRKRTVSLNGEEHDWLAMRVEPHHANKWGFAHGSFLAALGEIGASASYRPDDPPTVTIGLNVQFVRAAKVGDVIEVRGSVTGRTRTLVFTTAEGSVEGTSIFTATAIHKVIT